MNLKSERLKKYENELQDLEQWLKLGLVPKKDLKKHEEEIASIKEKIQEEKARLRFLKESGEMDEYPIPKRSTNRPLYAEQPTMPGMDVGEEDSSDSEIDMETETYETETTSVEEDASDEEEVTQVEEEEDPFSDRNRWKRGVWEDPDNPEW